eukprot:Skav227502  [mRNA]  locus=scaffold282:207220:207561:+ [translate_table: standard]
MADVAIAFCQVGLSRYGCSPWQAPIPPASGSRVAFAKQGLHQLSRPDSKGLAGPQECDPESRIALDESMPLAFRAQRGWDESMWGDPVAGEPLRNVSRNRFRVALTQWFGASL